MTTIDFGFLSDTYKDAYGFRPSADTRAHWATLSLAEIAALEAQLCRDVAASIADERAAEARAVTAFEAEVAALVTNQGVDHATAIRWLVQAEGAERDVAGYGMSYFAWLRGLPPSYFGPVYP